MRRRDDVPLEPEAFGRVDDERVELLTGFLDGGLLAATGRAS
ncbi:hypothetical protein SERN_1027 [Serinibacter arcticus]|uniref:Uncharacterized protein n=1 Tax=Serinibacter arcticus TaxID=1655435 RepID=A0A4Z1E3I3_9MICO|nr:hypothetical protein SERN_1027 [Serinibacter arcticus]